MPTAKYKLDYWPLPFRGCFVTYLFAYRDITLLLGNDAVEIDRQRSLAPHTQPIPHIGPPVLHDLAAGRSISQMPAIVLYVSPELDLMPETAFDQALALKVLMDCNDLLMEICRYNGSMMWQREDWLLFRSERLPRWISVFEESLARGTIGREHPSFADIGTFALFGNMLRCLPQLEADLRRHGPQVYEHCQRIGAKTSLAQYVAEDEARYGQLYCGGQIEESIREMLERDQAGA